MWLTLFFRWIDSAEKTAMIANNTIDQQQQLQGHVVINVLITGYNRFLDENNAMSMEFDWNMDSCKIHSVFFVVLM